MKAPITKPGDTGRVAFSSKERSKRRQVTNRRMVKKVHVEKDFLRLDDVMDQEERAWNLCQDVNSHAQYLKAKVGAGLRAMPLGGDLSDQ